MGLLFGKEPRQFLVLAFGVSANEGRGLLCAKEDRLTRYLSPIFEETKLMAMN